MLRMIRRVSHLDQSLIRTLGRSLHMALKAIAPSETHQKSGEKSPYGSQANYAPSEYGYSGDFGASEQYGSNYGDDLNFRTTRMPYDSMPESYHHSDHHRYPKTKQTSTTQRLLDWFVDSAKKWGEEHVMEGQNRAEQAPASSRQHGVVEANSSTIDSDMNSPELDMDEKAATALEVAERNSSEGGSHLRSSHPNFLGSRD